MKPMYLTLVFVLSFSALRAVGDHDTRTFNVSFQRGIHHGKGLRRTESSKEFLRKARRLSRVHVTDAIPARVDISGMVSPPEDQGSCGSCWSFSLTKALRSAWMVQGNDPGKLSFNYLLNNCGPGTKEWGCGGGDFNAADNFTTPHGPGLDSQDPYTASEGRCKKLPPAAWSVSHTMLGGNDGPTFKDLAYAIGVQKLMVSIDVAVMGEWENYGGGIYNGCVGGPEDINHMVDLTSYSCETSVDANGNCVFTSTGKPINGDGWIGVQNNWGTSWGEGGYMRTRMYGKDGKKCNGIATDALVFQVKATPQPLPPPVPIPVPPVVCTKWLCPFWCGFPWCGGN